MYYQTRNYDIIFTPTNTLPEVLQQPRLRSDVMADIQKDAHTYESFLRLPFDAQEALIDFCMGNRGLKITYDPFFHKIFHPETHPERLSSLISAILKQKVTIKRVLPREGIQLSDGSSLMIMDLLVELEDGSLVNVEIQRHGFYFPMQRSSCYGSDLLVRQYAQLRDIHGKEFSYKMMRPVYVIVLMESSPCEFHQLSDTFVHHSQLSFDSGIKLDNLLNFIYIPLDIFRDIPHNEIGELEAWLYFLSSDNPTHIQRILDKYPFFAELYKEIIDFRFHPKELIGMYSEALAIMDRNTINLMIDDMKKEAEDLKEELATLHNELTECNNELAERNNELAEKDNILAEQAAEIKRLRNLLEQQK